jgi:hypothetical protein
VGEGEGGAGGALAAPEPADDERAYRAELARELKAAAKAGAAGASDGSGEDDGGSSDEEAAQRRRAGGQKRQAGGGGEEEVDLEAMKDIMMSRKTRKFYERIKRAQQGKRERVEVLETRKAALQKKQRSK